jgi:hypothetical protein
LHKTQHVADLKKVTLFNVKWFIQWHKQDGIAQIQADVERNFRLGTALIWKMPISLLVMISWVARRKLIGENLFTRNAQKGQKGQMPSEESMTTSFVDERLYAQFLSSEHSAEKLSIRS